MSYQLCLTNVFEEIFICLLRCLDVRFIDLLFFRRKHLLLIREQKSIDIIISKLQSMDIQAALIVRVVGDVPVEGYVWICEISDSPEEAKFG